MKRVLVLLLASIVGVVVMTCRRKARDSSDLWAEATRAPQTPPPLTGLAQGAAG